MTYQMPQTPLRPSLQKFCRSPGRKYRRTTLRHSCWQFLTMCRWLLMRRGGILGTRWWRMARWGLRTAPLEGLCMTITDHRRNGAHWERGSIGKAGSSRYVTFRRRGLRDGRGSKVGFGFAAGVHESGQESWLKVDFNQKIGHDDCHWLLYRSKLDSPQGAARI